MTDTPDTSAEAVERLAARVDGAECKAGCGSMAVCMCAYAADCVDTLRALAAERDALRAERDAIQAAARDCFDAQTEIDETWDAIGTRGNRAAVSLSEQVSSLCRELDDGSFYKEADIDRLMGERDALRARAEAAEIERDRLRDSVETALQSYEVSGNRTVLLERLNAALTVPAPRHR